jgi:predicted nucleic acid-binding protein
VPEPPVVNASPLILLTRADHLDLLRAAGERVVVPRAVVREIHAYGPADPTAIALSGTDWIEAVDVETMPLDVARWDLGPGESEVLAWALAHRGCEAIIDDHDARRCAATLGVPVRGTLGLVLLAKRRGIVTSARSVIGRLRAAGMYLSDEVIAGALSLVGE